MIKHVIITIVIFVQKRNDNKFIYHFDIIHILISYKSNEFSGYSDEPSIDHCVAVISFGKEVQVLQKYSNDYSNMLHILGEKFCKMYGLSINIYIMSQ